MKSKTIGIIGTKEGAGVTHMALAMANYMKNVLGLSVGIFEVSHDKKLENLLTEELILSEDILGFRLLGIDIYPTIELCDLRRMLFRRYDCSIVIFRYHTDDALHTWVDLDDKIIMCDTALWNRISFDSLINRVNHLTNDMTGAGTFKIFGNLKIDSNCNLKNRPFIEDPFRLTSDNLYSLGNIIGLGKIKRKVGIFKIIKNKLAVKICCS